MIVGFSFNKISIEKKHKPIKNMKVRYNIDFSDVREETLALKTAQKSVGFDFVFTVHYDPNVAVVAIHGTISYMSNKKEVDHIISTWKQKKQIPKSVSVPIINLALDRCNVKTLELTQDLHLPTHLPMPRVNVSQTGAEDPNQYIG